MLKRRILDIFRLKYLVNLMWWSNFDYGFKFMKTSMKIIYDYKRSTSNSTWTSCRCSVDILPAKRDVHKTSYCSPRAYWGRPGLWNERLIMSYLHLLAPIQSLKDIQSSVIFRTSGHYQNIQNMSLCIIKIFRIYSRLF